MRRGVRFESMDCVCQKLFAKRAIGLVNGKIEPHFGLDACDAEYHEGAFWRKYGSANCTIYVANSSVEVCRIDAFRLFVEDCETGVVIALLSCD